MMKPWQTSFKWNTQSAKGEKKEQQRKRTPKSEEEELLKRSDVPTMQFVLGMMAWDPVVLPTTSWF